MSNITRSVIVQASTQQVWAILGDFGGVHRWHPKVETSPITNDISEGLGAERICNFYDGTSVKEEIVEYREGEMLKVVLSEFSMPLNHGEATISLRKLSDEETEVSFSMDYEVKYGPLGWVMNSLMMTPMMGKMFEQVLGALDHHVVTGELIGRDGEHIEAVVAA